MQHPPLTASPPRGPAILGPARLGLVVLAGLFGIGGVWAAIAPLSSGVVAAGEVVAEGNRRSVQHLEGGIIREFRVRDGQMVRRGETLVVLDDTQAAANAEALRTQYDTLRAQIARIASERAEDSEIRFPPDLVERAQDARTLDILQAQKRIAEARRNSKAGEVDIQRERVAQLEKEIESLEGQSRAASEQLRLIQSEITDVQGLLNRGLERRPRLLALQRQEAGLIGSREQANALIARARQAIAETRLQISQIENRTARELSDEQRETLARLAEVQERLRVAADVERRGQIQAPLDGIVTGLRQHTIGAVLRPGEVVLDLVPTAEQLVVEAKLAPNDVDVVYVGMPAEVRFPAFRARVVPILFGTVTYVAGDVTQEQRTNQTHYRVSVKIPPEQLALLNGNRLVPGMSAEVIFKAGERTLLQYLTQPLTESFRRAWPE